MEEMKKKHDSQTKSIRLIIAVAVTLSLVTGAVFVLHNFNESFTY